MEPQPVVLGILVREGRVFVQRRSPSNPVWPGRWEFPGGKVEVGETEEEALIRELREELQWTPHTCEPWFVVEAGAVVLRAFRCEGPGLPSTPLAWGWFTWTELRRLPMPEPNRQVLDRCLLA